MTESNVNGVGKSVGRYLMPEMVPVLDAAMCLAVVLSKSPKAKALFDEVVQGYGLPDFKAMAEAIKAKLPDVMKLADDIGKVSGFKKPKGNAWPELQLADSKAWKGVSGYLGSYIHAADPWVDFKKNRWKSRELGTWFGKIEELIKVGFNNPVDLAKGQCKMDPGKSPSLIYAIMVVSAAVYFEQKIKPYEKARLYPYGKGWITVKDIMDYTVPNRFHREFSKQARKSGYELHHDDKMIDGAVWWYQSRVTFAGPKEFCDWYATQEDGCVLEPANVSNAIRVYDKAVGYQRKSTKPSALKPNNMRPDGTKSGGIIGKVKAFFSRKKAF